jgi:hypothetical protein
MDAFATYFTGELDEKKLLLWGSRCCSKLTLVSWTTETTETTETNRAPRRAFLGVWNWKSDVSETTIKNRVNQMHATVKNWGGRVHSIENMSMEAHAKILLTADDLKSVVPKVHKKDTKEETASTSKRKATALDCNSPTTKIQKNASASSASLPGVDNSTSSALEAPETPEAPARLASVMSIASVAPALRSLAPAVATVDAAALGALLPLFGILENLRFKNLSDGSTIWKNALQAAKNAKLSPDKVPPTYPVKISGRSSKGLRTCDLSKALILAIPEEELRVLLAETEVIQALRDLVTKSHHTIDSTTGVTEDFSVDDLLAEVEKKRKREDDLLISVQLPELIAGAGPLACRVRLAMDGVTPLGSVHDFLKWLQVDKDGKNHDWNDWLCEVLKSAMDQLCVKDPQSPQPVLETHNLKGRKTPMGNVEVFRMLTRLCVDKSPVAAHVVDEALTLWTDKLSECPDLSDETRYFLRPKRVRREENVGGQGMRNEEAQRQDESTQLVLIGNLQLALIQNNKEAERRMQLALVQTLKDADKQAESRFENMQLALVQTLKDADKQAESRFENMQLALVQNHKEAQRRAEDAELRIEILQLTFTQNNKQAERRFENMQLALIQKVQQVSIILSLKVSSLSQSIVEKIWSPQSVFVNAPRKAVKKPAIKTSVDEAKYPSSQMATPEQLMGCTTLSSALLEIMRTSNRFPDSEPLKLSYGAWLACRSLIGQRCIKLRKAAAGAGQADGKPLMWHWQNTDLVSPSNGGGQHYVYYTSEATFFLRQVLEQTHVRSSATTTGSGPRSETIFEHVARLIHSQPAQDWPLSSNATL